VNVPRFLRRLFHTPYDGLQHFGVVTEGRLYRCGQPRPEELTELIQRYGLRTVVVLRGVRADDDPDAWERDERAVCAAHDVLFVAIPCNHKNPPTRAQADEFLSLFRTAERTPVLVHCRLGQQRTLLFAGLYRVALEGWDAARAEAEMEALGFCGGKRRHWRLRDAFRALAAELTGR
jgi:protein tyrosine/serine phosphatase